MRISNLFIICFFAFPSVSKAQTLRYFEFRFLGSSPEWRDTSIVAATKDSTVIADVLSEIASTTHKHIKGSIIAGHGGYNNNATHAFNWHFTESAWHLEQFSEEVCDGRAYSDVHSDTAYWIGFLGYFCGWSYQPVREILSAGIVVPDISSAPVAYPNPASGDIGFSFADHVRYRQIILMNSDGKSLRSVPAEDQHVRCSLHNIPPGVVVYRIDIGGVTVSIGRFASL